MPKPIVFVDWHGTLSSSLFWHSFYNGSAKEKYLAQRIRDEIFASDIDGDSARLDESWDNGEITSEEFVRWVSDHIGEPYELMWFRFVEDCKNFSVDSVSYFDQIASLRDFATVVLATDQGEAFHRFFLPEVPLDNHFDDLLISSKVGATKNSPREFFAGYHDQIQNRKGLLIDDSPHICESFESIGGASLNICSKLNTSQALSEALRWARSQSYV